MRQVMSALKSMPTNIQRGDVIGVFTSVLVILFVIYFRNINESMLGFRVVDIVGLILLLFVIAVTGKFVNNKINGFKKYLPACHDFIHGITYCARHNGFYFGLFFWLAFGILLVHNCFVELSCSILTGNVFLRWLMLFLLILTPAHGWATKIGFKLSDFDRFLTAFFWALLVVLNAFLIYKWVLSPC